MESTGRAARALAFHKIGLARTLLAAGLDVLMADADAIFLRDPTGYFAGCALGFTALHAGKACMAQSLLQSALHFSWLRGRSMLCRAAEGSTKRRWKHGEPEG
jgi:hypothetical protein